MTLLYARAIAAVLLLALAAAGAGRWIAPLYRREACSLERTVLGLLGGLGVFGTALFVAGQFFFPRWLIAAALMVAALCGIAPLAQYLRSGFQFLQSYPIPKLAAAVIVVVLVVTAVAGLAEITGGWDNDAIAYHLLGPKVWLRDGVIRPVPDNCHTAFPQTAEVLFAVLLSVAGERAPGFSAVFTLGLFLLSVALLARRLGLGRAGAWWSMALVASMPAIYAGGHSGFIDVIYSSFVLAAAVIVLQARVPADFATLGLFCGLAMGTKYTGVLAVPALLIVSAWLWRKERASWRQFLANWSIAAAVAALLAAPFYLRNWIILGSPLYPPPAFLLHFFHPKYLTAEVIHQLQAYLWQRGAGLGRGPLAYLSLPFNLTYHTSRFHGAGGIGLAPLAFAPLGLWLGWRNRYVQGLVLLAWLMATLWFFQQESRFLIPVYAMTAVLAVLGWRGLLSTAGKSATVLAAAAMLLSVSYGGYMIVSARKADLHSALSPEYAQRMRAEGIPFLESFEYLNGAAAVHKVLILDRSVPPYYLDRSYLKPIGQWGEQVLPGVERAVDVLPHAKEYGVTHVLDVRSTMAPFQVPEKFPGFELVVDLPDQRVYQVH
jgi:hypothetical protein